MKKVFMALSFVMVFSLGNILAQTRTITGTVTGSDDGQPIPGASVFVKGTTMGTITQIDGDYSLSVPQDAAVLVFSFVGMESQEQEIAGRTVINVVLNSSAIQMDEVIVVAYGTSTKSSFTGSASVVRAETIERRTVASITKALEGTVAGVQSTAGGGQPGSGANMRIRGFGSINASSAPLYVVDGIPYDGNINAINPNDISSVSVLKDASASALYGARGANGVVIITTKKGVAGESKINLKVTSGISSRGLPNYSTVNERQYMELAFESVKNSLIFEDGQSPGDAANEAITTYMSAFGGEQYNPFDIASGSLIDPSTGRLNPNSKLRYSSDWIDEATRSNPMRNEYQLSITGGNERTSYLMSAGYLTEEGLAKNTQFDRYSARLNVDSDVKEWIRSGMSVSFASTKQNYLTDSGSAYNNIWFSAATMGPIYPVYKLDSDDSPMLDDLGQKVFDYGETRPSASNYNSIATLFEDKREVKYDNVSGRGYAQLGTDREDLGFLKDLRLDINFGFDYYHGSRLVYNNPFFGDGASVGGRGNKYSYRTFSSTFNQLLNYSKDFGASSIDVLVGHEYYNLEKSTHYSAKQGFAFGNLYELNAAAIPTAVESWTDTYKVESYLSRINYDYSDKLYLSASFRTDGSSRFYSDNRWGQFWSLGAAWRISEESFMESYDFIDNITIKASYGSQGNDMLLNSDNTDNYYAWQGFYDLTFPNNTNGGVYLFSLENKELEWEKNQNLNIGIESQFFQRRFGFSLDYYERKTTDLLLFKPMATSTGFDGYWDNVGDMINKGIDVAIDGVIIKGDNFQWNANLLWSRLRNEVTKLNTDDQEIIIGSRIIKVGEPVNSFYLSKSAGVDPETGAQLYYVRSTDGEGNEIDIVTDNYNQAGANKYIQGNRIPDFYGSIGSDFRYRNFDLSILTTYSVGGKVYDSVYGYLMQMRNAGTAWHSDMLRAWKQPGDETDVPRLELGGVNQVTDRYLFDASYFAIKNITLGYNFSSLVSSRIGIDQLRLFATADNVALFSKLKGNDPQYNFSGGQDFSYVPIRTISLGLDLKF